MSISTGAPMRAPGSERPPRAQEPGRRFDDVLARARGPGEERKTPGARATATPRRPERFRAAAADGVEGRERGPAAPGAALLAAPRLGSMPGLPELQAALRAAPPAIAAAVAQGKPQLALAFGTALSIDLRAGAQGLEVSLRPAAPLERAARAELPALVEALRARGLRVARAEVRARPTGRPSARPR